MSNTEFPHRLWGRKVRPNALFISTACLVIAWGQLCARNGPGDLIDVAIWSYPVGTGALIAALLLWYGFWEHSDFIMQMGFLGAVGVWVARWALTTWDLGFVSQPAMLSACWVGICLGSYLLEETTGDKEQVNG